MDLALVKREIEEYIKISNENKIILPNSEQSIKMSPQEFINVTKTLNLTQNNLELKVEEIYKVNFIYFVPKI